MKKQIRGLTLIEMLLALSVSLGIIAGSVALYQTAQARSEASRASSDIGRILSEVQRLYGSTHQIGYGALTVLDLRARGADLEDLYVAAQQRYRAASAIVNVAPSTRLPGGGTGVAGDGFLVEIAGMKPRMCESAVNTFARSASFVSAVAGGTEVTVTGVPGVPDHATVVAACDRPPAVTLRLHFN